MTPNLGATPKPICAACGHPVSEHGECSGCWHGTIGDGCDCRRMQRECALPVPKPAPRMVPLDAVLDLVNEAVADLKRDLEARAEKEARP